jgi:exonuclease SbcC
VRPLELRIANFRSYFGAPVVFDFRGRRLTGIVGPIGSGKSSILDAVSFALYGRTSTIAGATKSLIHQRADGATVALRFEVDGEVWQVMRAPRRKGQSQHALVHLAADADDAEELQRVVLEADVNAKVIELLGLEFDAFSRSVLLAQGRFAEFLSSQPAERDRVLKGVFGHDRIDAMREVAKEHVRAESAELDRLAGRLDQLARLEQRLVENRAAILDLDERIERLQKAEPAFVDLDEREATARAAGESARKRLDEVAAHAGRLPSDDVVAGQIAEAEEAGAKRAELASRLDEAQATLVEAEQAVEDAELAGSAETIEQAGAALARRQAALTRVKEIEAKLAELVETEAAASREGKRTAASQAKAAARVESTAASLAEASNARQAAEGRAREARHLDMADALRAGLEPGHLCPVCRQAVHEVPPQSGSALAAAERALVEAGERHVAASEALAAAEADVSEARDAATRAEMLAATIEAEVVAWRQQRVAAEAVVADIDAALASLLGDGDAAALLDEARASLRALGGAAAEARKALDRARGAHDEAIVAEQTAGRQVAELRVLLTDIAARLDTQLSAAEGAAGVAAAFLEVKAAWSETVATLGERVTVSSAEVEAVGTERDRLRGELDIEKDIVTELGGAIARSKLLAEQIDADVAEVEAASALATERELLIGRIASLERIAGDLTNAGFIRFLLDDERARLADLGSEHFQRLSFGRYRFTEDGKFDIVDLAAADAVRKADSLSGGETFVASLGLALALAEMVSGVGGRLDAFFIDEGFGSLDPEHLDLAMDGIEALAAGEGTRLVVVVSHVPELRQRVEDLIELDRDPVTGDTKVLRS